MQSFRSSLFLLAACTRALPPPDCFYPGRSFAGSGDFQDITAHCGCAARLQQEFSLAWTQNIQPLTLGVRVFAFHEGQSNNAVFCGIKSDRPARPFCRAISPSGRYADLVGEAFVLGEATTFLLVVDGSARAVLYQDGVQVDEVSNFVVQEGPRTLHLGKTVTMEHFATGFIGNMRLWHTAVSKEDVAWPPKCAYDGGEFNGAQFEDITAQCGSAATLGAEFSVAFTARADRLQNKDRVFAFAAGKNDKNFFCSVRTDRMGCKNRDEGQGGEVLNGDALVVGETHRYLLVVWGNDTAMLWTDGVKQSEDVAWFGSAGARTLYVSKSHWNAPLHWMGAIEDLWIWPKTGVLWNSASVEGEVYSDNSCAQSSQTATTMNAESTTTSAIGTALATSAASMDSATSAASAGLTTGARSMASTTAELTTGTVTSTPTSESFRLVTSTSSAAGPTPTSLFARSTSTVPSSPWTDPSTFPAASSTAPPVALESSAAAPESSSTTAHPLLSDIEAALHSGLAALGSASRVDIPTSAGTVAAFGLDALKEAQPAMPLAVADGAMVLLPEKLLRALPPGSAMAALSVNGSAQQRLASGQLATPVLELSIVGKDGKKLTELPAPLVFRLPSSNVSGDAYCAFLDTRGAEPFWSREGVRRVAGDDGIWCETTHLSIFAALINAVLGCTNLELLTPDGMQALASNEGWWRTRPAVLTFLAVGVAVLAVAAGVTRECWALRLGRTQVPGKAVKLCRFLSIGPQIVKHKYAAFALYVRDVLQCMRKGRGKLRKPTIKQGIQRFLAVRTGISTACVTQHCWSGGAWQETSASLPHAVLMKKLQFHCGMADEVIKRDLRGAQPQHFLWRFLIVFLACHPVLDSLRLGAGSMSVLKRGTLQLSSFLGVLATNAMIFNFSGEQRSWEADAECPISPTSQLFILVATLASMLMGVIPNQFLADVAKQVHGRPGWNVVFWALALAYLCSAAFIAALALANLNEKDQGKWHASLRWSLTLKLLGMPFAQALRHYLLLEHFLHEDRQTQHIEVSMGMAHAAEEKMEESEAKSMAARAVSASDLLRFFSILGGEVMPDFTVESTVQEVWHAALRRRRVKVSVAENVTVLHLGALRQRQRPCLREVQGREVVLAGMEAQHAIGFIVSGKVAVLPMESLAGSFFAGDLALTEDESFSPPPSAKAVAARAVTASGGREAVERGCVAVKVEVMGEEVNRELLPQGNGAAPVDRMVLHCWQASFAELVASVAEDAVARAGGSREAVAQLLQSGDIEAVLALLQKKDARYWLDIFALDVLDEKCAAFAMPAVARQLRAECGNRVIADLRAAERPTCALPVQLLVMDERCSFLRDSKCLAGAMLTRAVGMEQHMLLQAAHINGPLLAQALKQLEPVEEWALAVVQDQQEACEALKLLAIKAAKAKESEDTLMKQMSDTAAVAAGALSSRSKGETADEAEAEALDDAGDAADGAE